jgi:hypothetical protein
VDDRKRVLKSGRFAAREIGFGVSTLGTIEVPLADLTVPQHVELVVDIPAAGAANGWELWIYPRDADTTAGDVHVARRYDDETRAALAAGRRVLLLASLSRPGRSPFVPRSCRYSGRSPGSPSSRHEQHSL